MKTKQIIKKEKTMNLEQRKERIIARGEHSNHAHIITGNAVIERKGEDIFITVNDDTVKIRHLLETAYLAGNEVWTEEHTDIAMAPGTYKYIPQVEFNPLNELIVRVVD